MALKKHLLFALVSGTVYPVTFKSVNLLSFSIQNSKIRLLKTVLANFVNFTSNESTTWKLLTKPLILLLVLFFYK